ncbi:MAG TPA: lysophospholipid acyltransferase family protein [Myxococcota bacterium]|nr:lysophospholipid acyltransferase family protein [Myxococcota bacterium]
MESVERRASIGERALAFAVAWLVRLLGATLRFDYEDNDVIEQTLAEGSAAIIFGWHEMFLIACCDLRHYRPYIMISQSRDGERVTRVAEQLGWRVVRGSSSRGGARALLQMVRVLREPVLAGHLVDGPRGPRREIKPGVVAMAQRSRAVLIPSMYAVQRKWRAPSWDRLQVPLPFTRIVRHDLPARCVRPDLDEAEVEKLRAELHDELTRECAAFELERLGQSER